MTLAPKDVEVLWVLPEGLIMFPQESVYPNTSVGAREAAGPATWFRLMMSVLLMEA
jgi:hypothetical protein